MLDDHYSLLDRIKFAYNAKVKYKPQHRSYIQPMCFVLLWLLAVGLAFGAISFDTSWMQASLAGLYLTVLMLFLSLVCPPQKL